MISAVPGGENTLHRSIAAAAEQFDITSFIELDELFKKLSIGNMTKRREIPLAGSVDEKLQTCDFKLRQYKKMFEPIGLNVKYVYVLNDWFKKKEYADVLAYIKSVDCDYFFNELPLSYLGLPVPHD